MNRETQLMQAIRYAVNRTGRARLMRNSVGYDAEARVRYGLGVGSADLVGMLRGGRVFVLEVKTASGRTTSEQQAWLDTVRRFGGFAAVVRSVDDALAALERAEAGADQ